jgi:putative ABC transport system permease protein
MHTLFRDIRYSVRSLAGSPGFTIVAILALALGIGANTAIFSAVNAVLLRPLPFDDPDRLVQIWASTPSKGVPFHNMFYSDACEWRRQAQSFDAMSACAPGTTNLTMGDEPERLSLWRVNASFFPMLGTQFHAGRGFLPEDDRPGAAKVAVMTHALWQRRFGSDRKVVGSVVTLDGVGHTIIGILPSGFEVTGRTVDLFSPVALSGARGPGSDDTTVVVFARLKRGVSIPQAQAEMDIVGGRLRQFRGSLGVFPRVWGLRDFVVRDIRLSLIVLLGAVALVLLIACANVANLLLARAGARQRELAVRAALGASRGRILRHLLTESSILGLAGGAGGVLLAWWGLRALLQLVPDRFPLLSHAGIDARVLGFTVIVSLMTGIVFGLAPALAASRSSVMSEALKEGGRGSGESIARSRLRSTLVVVEVALALVLLIGAGLLTRSFIRLNDINPGFNPRGVLTASISLPASAYKDPGQRIAFWRHLFEQLESIPGVVASGAASSLPLTQHNTGTGLIVEGRPIPQPTEIPIVWFRTVNAAYFRAMEIPLRSGRSFNDQDQKGPPVAIVNETMARRHWPNEDVIGKRFTSGLPPPGRPITWITIVGVVGDLRHKGLNVEADAEVFWPYQQHAPAGLSLAVRVTDSDAAQFAPLLRKAISSVDRQQPVSQIRSMEQILEGSIAAQRLSVTLLGIFAALAVVLAGVGIYGVISFSVARRTQEIGVRLALGARGGDVVGMVVRQALTLTLAGVGIGLAAAFGLTRFLGSLLYGVSATDPWVLAGVSLLLTGIAFAASYIPARRAALVDPIIALRYE